jgi:hypothetical protein
MDAFKQMATTLAADRGPRKVDLQEHMSGLIAKHGSMCKAAAACGVYVEDFSRIYNGKRPGSDAVLQKLGLRRIVHFEEI